MTFKLLPLVVLGALAAGCGNETSTDTETPIEGSERASPAAYVMGPGRYAIEGGDGTVYSQTVVKPDGTYADLDGEGNEVGRGTWRDERGLACFDPDGDGPDQQERCWTNSALAEDGSFTSTRDDGSESHTLRPIGG